MNFNNQQYLFENKRVAELQKDPPLRVSLTVVDGHIIQGREVLARCTNTREAEELLKSAGWRKDMGASVSESIWTANPPQVKSAKEWEAKNRKRRF